MWCVGGRCCSSPSAGRFTEKFLPLGRLLLALCFATAISAPAQQPQADWNARLVGKPLYLRGFPISDDLAYDGDGTLRGKSDVAPFTLCGIDVTSVEEHGRSLVLHGVRVALVSDAADGPGLRRKRISSTTHLTESLRRGDKRLYKAEEEIRITVHPDSNGSYETALGKVFLDGEAALAGAVPLYWRCYAAAYFGQAGGGADAQTDVRHCVSTSRDGSVVTPGPPDAAGSPRLVSALAPQFPQRDADLGVNGTARVHLLVTKAGQPVGLQVVQALGGGIDEAILQALSHAQFEPATRDGVPVDAGMDLQFTFGRPPAP